MFSTHTQRVQRVRERNMSSRTTNDDDGARNVTHPFMPGWPLNWHCVRFHHPESAESAELCASDRAILDLEESWQAGSLSVDKETAIRDSLGLSSPRYHLRLNELIDDEKAAQYAPSLVGRLQRVRSQQRRSRSAQLLR